MHDANSLPSEPSGMPTAAPDLDSAAYTDDRVPWNKLLYLVFFLVVINVVEILAAVSALFQFVAGRFGAGISAPVADFGARLGVYAAEVVRFLSFADAEPPYPFSDFPPVSPGGEPKRSVHQSTGD